MAALQLLRTTKLVTFSEHDRSWTYTIQRSFNLQHQTSITSRSPPYLHCELVAGVMIFQFDARQTKCASVNVLGTTVHEVDSAQNFHVICRPAFSCHKHFTMLWNVAVQYIWYSAKLNKRGSHKYIRKCRGLFQTFKDLQCFQGPI